MIKDFSTAYWGLLPTTSRPYPAHPKVNAFVGASGHGKTTIMDGLRLLLGDAKFENNRDALHYMHDKSKWAVVRASFYNEPVERVRPFESAGFQGDEVTCCCLVTVNSNGRLEKEYYVFNGVFTDIIDLGTKPKAYSQSLKTQKQYKQILEECLGVTPAFRNLMSMNPTTVKNLVHLDANDLFLKVFELKGVKKIHDNYRAAKDELGRQEVNLHQTQNSLNEGVETFEHLQLKSEKFKENQSNRIKLYSVKQKTLKVEFWESKVAIQACEEKNSNLKNEINTKQDKKVDLGVQSTTIQTEILRMEAEKEQCKIAVSKLQREIVNLSGKVGELASDRKKINQEVLRLQEIKPLDRERFVQDHIEAMEILEVARNDWRNDKDKLDSLQKRKKDLDQSRPYPDHVYQFTSRLIENKIENILLADAISLKPEYEKWQLAVEAYLGNERFRIIVNQDQEIEAKRLQEEYRYTSRMSIPKPEVLSHSKRNITYPTIRSVINVAHPDKVGGYISRLNDIYLVETVEEGHSLQKQGLTSITIKGLQQDYDGSIFRKHHRLCCGRMALEKERALTEIEIKNQREIVKEKETLVREYENELNRLQTIINEQNELYNLPGMENYINILNSTYRALSDEKCNKENECIGLNNKQEEIEKLLTEGKITAAVYSEQEKQCTQEIERLAHEIRVVVQEMEIKRQDLEEIKQKLFMIGVSEDDIEFIPQDISTPDFKNEKGEIYSSKELKKESERLIENINSFIRENPDIDDTVVELVKTQEALVNQLQYRFNKIKEERDNWEQECNNSLAALQGHIKETMKDFIEEFHMIADLIGANATGRLEPRGEDPDLWELYLSIGFDGKKPALINSPELSSGQRARTSLLVLLAAVSSKRRGEKLSIMFLDEPNAEVDDYSGNDIGQVFQVTDIQYFITHQIGESLKSIQWINHSFLCSQCPPDSDFARPLLVQKMRTD
ncbi:AAA family ATPase [Cohnella phaseoli]|uniref:Chromosome segregation ATPase n=1 Tax=Cohnella phaseoli TaxID=456490 RepID=A0A3D9HQN4_9BACL|nr:AAA family ATPase [Cohnella phaseoli]RED51780.1 chromosome segregation ATPase [Cohnella phaseoli]